VGRTESTLSYEKCDYYRQGGDLVAGYSCYDQWVDVNEVARLNAHANTEMEEIPTYTKQQMEEIYAAQDAEEIRGATPRYWKMSGLATNCNRWYGDRTTRLKKRPGMPAATPIICQTV